MDEQQQFNVTQETLSVGKGDNPQPEAAAQPPAEQIRYPSGLVLPTAQPAPAPRVRTPLKRGNGKDLALALVLLGFCFLLWDTSTCILNYQLQ